MRFFELNAITSKIIHLPTVALDKADNLEIVAAFSLVSLQSLLRKA